MLYVGIALGIVLIWLLAAYNKFVRLKQMVAEAWSGIDVQLKRRADLIPNLIEVVSGYAKHERTTFEEVTRRRAMQQPAATTAERSAVENELTKTIGTIFAVAEAYPELKANDEFLKLQHTLVEIEDQIQFARRYYNGASRDYNILLHTFPSSIVATIYHFTEYEYFELETITERNTPEATFK